jgi:acetyl-CoA carboxylase biotin carboxyl carrier protein
MDLKYLKELIQIFEKTGLESLSLKEKNGTEITLGKGRGGNLEHSPVAREKRESVVVKQVQEIPESDFPTKQESDEQIDPKKCISSPMVGTFYRASAPDAPHLVEVGKEIKKGDILCIIEAMKVMNEIKSDRAGRVNKILVENGCPVEYGQHLFQVE